MGLVLNWRQVFEIDDSRYSKKNFWRYNMVQTNERDSDPVFSSSPERTMYGIFRNNNKKKDRQNTEVSFSRDKGI